LDSSSFASSNNGTSGETPYPGAEYEDLGIKVKVTPTLHANHEVTLQLEFEIRALANSSVNGIPVLSNRTLSQTVRVPVDQPSVLGGLTDREETRSITGLPGFAEIPGPPGYAFGDRSNTFQDTELLIVVTPRELRTPDHDTKAIYAGRGDPGGQGGGGASARQFEPPARAPQPVGVGQSEPQPGTPSGTPPAAQPGTPGETPARGPGQQQQQPSAPPTQENPLPPPPVTPVTPPGR
jgi:type II secretory pathway component GspD/PulD (secretin)